MLYIYTAKREILMVHINVKNYQNMVEIMNFPIFGVLI